MADERPTASLNELLEKKQLEQKRANNWLPLKVAAGAVLGNYSGMRYNGHVIGSIKNNALFEQARKHGVPAEDILFGNSVDKDMLKRIQEATNKALAEEGLLAKAANKAPVIAVVGAAMGAGIAGLMHTLSAKAANKNIEKITTSEGWQHYLENQQASTGANRGRA